MRVLRVFFLGLLYGWCMKWIIDEIYRNDNLRMIANENEYLRDRVRALEAVRSAPPRAASSRPAQASVATPAPPERTRPATAPTPQLATVSAGKDDLKRIKGVGPKMEQKLNEAGIRTFEHMSRLTTSELQAILGISKRVTQNADNLLTQARKLAQKNVGNQ